MKLNGKRSAWEYKFDGDAFVPPGLAKKQFVVDPEADVLIEDSTGDLTVYGPEQIEATYPADDWFKSERRADGRMVITGRD